MLPIVLSQTIAEDLPLPKRKAPKQYRLLLSRGLSNVDPATVDTFAQYSHVGGHGPNM